MDANNSTLRVKVFTKGTANGVPDGEQTDLQTSINNFLKDIPMQDVQSTNVVCSSDPGFRLIVFSVTYIQR